MHFVGAEDDVRRDAAAGKVSGVGPVFVVVAEVPGEVSPECGELGHERTGAGRTPALFEFGPLDTFHAAVGLGAASRDADMLRPKVMGGRPEVLGTALRAVVGGDPSGRPPSGFEVPGDALGERTREPRVGVVGRLVELDQGGGARNVDGRVLPDAPLRAAQPSYGHAIQPDDVPGLLRLDVPLLLGCRTFWSDRDSRAHDGRQPACPRLQANPLAYRVHSPWREDDATPAFPGQLRSDAARPQPGEAEGEGDDALLDPRQRVVRHLWWPPLPWPEGIQTPLADGR